MCPPLVSPHSESPYRTDPGEGEAAPAHGLPPVPLARAALLSLGPVVTEAHGVCLESAVRCADAPLMTGPGGFVSEHDRNGCGREDSQSASAMTFDARTVCPYLRASRGRDSSGGLYAL